MKCYLRDIHSFAVFEQYDVTEFDLALDSFDDEISTISVATDVPMDIIGSWLQFDGNLYIVKQITPDNRGQSKLRLAPWVDLFSREIRLNRSNYTSVGAFIRSVLLAQWVNQTDLEYKAGYMTVTNADTTEFEEPETDEAKLFNILDYIQTMRRKNNVRLSFEIQRGNSSGDVLAVIIEKFTPDSIWLHEKDGHTQVVSINIRRDIVSKLSCYQAYKTGQQDEDGADIIDYTETVWYLNTDGPSQTAGDRIKGAWDVLTIGEDDDLLESVTARFAENEETQKIELFTDQTMRVGDTLHLWANGQMLDGTVSGVFLSSKDSRTLYRSGDLLTTVSEKISALEGK